MENSNKRAVIYTRISKHENSYKLEVQRTKCMEYIQKKGLNRVGEYCDIGITGNIIDKDGNLKQLCDDISKGIFDCVVIYKLDRLGGKAMDILEIIEKLRKENIELFSCQEEIDHKSPAGRFCLNLFASIAEYNEQQLLDDE